MKTTQQSINPDLLLRFAAFGLLASLMLNQWTSVLMASSEMVAATAVSAISIWKSVVLSDTSSIIVTVLSAAQFGLIVLVSLAAPSQWVSGIYERAPLFLKWSCEHFIHGALLISACGVFLAFSQMAQDGSVIRNLVAVLHALLVAALSLTALGAAAKEDFAAYQQWAVRLFLVISAYWFASATGFDIVALVASFWGGQLSTSTEVFQPLASLAFAGIALLIYQVYLKTQSSGLGTSQLILSASFGLITTLMIAGIGNALI